MNTSDFEDFPDKHVWGRIQRNFCSHLMAGLCFLFWSFYTIFNTIQNYLKSENQSQLFTSCLWFSKPSPTSSRIRNWLTDYNMCMVFSLIQGTMAFALCFENGQYVVTEVQMCFALYVAFAAHCLVSGFKINLDKFHVDYLSLIVFNVNAAVIILGHQNSNVNPTMLQSSGHHLCARVLFGCAIVTALEAINRNSLTLPILRAWSTMVLATWFMQLAFALYLPVQGLPVWSSTSMHSMMAFTASFAAHCAFDMSVVIFICWILTKRFNGTNHIIWSPLPRVESEELLNGDEDKE